MARETQDVGTAAYVAAGTALGWGIGLFIVATQNDAGAYPKIFLGIWLVCALAGSLIGSQIFPRHPRVLRTMWLVAVPVYGLAIAILLIR